MLEMKSARLALFLFVGGLFSSLRAATYTVTPADFGSKVSAAKPGDVFLLRGGTYSKISSIPSGTSWGSAVTIKAYPGEKATIRKVGLVGSFQYIIFEDLFIDGETSSSGGNETVYLSGGANHIRFLRCDISRGLTHNILIPHTGSDFNEFIQTRIHHALNGIPRQHGIYASARGTLVDGCEIDHNGSYGVHFYNGYAGERADGQIVQNSKVHDNGIEDPSAAGIVLSSGDGSKALSNDLWFNPRDIDVAWRNPIGAVVRNNSPTTVYVNSDATGTLVENNCMNPLKITNNGAGTILKNNSLTACQIQTVPAPTGVTGH